MIENCPMRHENGNCIPAGGFCTANKNICEALLNAYKMGKAQLSEGTTKDAISRQAAIDALDCISGAEEVLRSLPTIQPERAKGEWSDGYRWQRCSLCKQTGKKSWNYCPNCGADMRGEKDERTD